MLRASIVVVVTGALALGTGCPPPIVEPPLVPLEISARVAADAPAANPDDAPPPDGTPAAVPESVTRIELGLLGVENGLTGDIIVDAKGLGALQVIVEGQPGATVILARVLDPDGAAVVDDAEPDGLPAAHLAFARGFPGPVFSLNRVLPSARSGAFLVPNTPSVEAADGTWTLRVGHYTVDTSTSPATKAALDRPVRVTLLARGQDTGAGGVDLNVHVAADVDAGFIDDALAVLRDAWAGADGANIQIGATRTLPVIADYAVLELAEGRCEGGELDALLETGADAPAGIDLYLVDGFVCVIDGGVDVGTAIGGISAGIPGPAWVRGATHAGVAVSVSRAAGDPRSLGNVIAHELGHYLGLYHTKESSSGAAPIEDEIEDSPAGDDADENLMYFATTGELSLSAGQAHVLRTSPFVTPVDATAVD